MSNKNIYEFIVNKKVKKEVVEEQGDTKITRTVEALEPVTIVLKRPSRAEGELIDFEYAKEHSNAMRAGVYTKAMVHKTLEEQGFLANHREATFDKSKRLQEIELEFRELYFKEDKDEADKIRLDELERNWEKIGLEVQEASSALESAFQNTAENRAEKKAALFLTLLVTYLKDEAGNVKPMFKGDSLEAKLKHYDALMDSEDSFFLEVGSKAGFFTSLWYLGKAQNPEDFEKIEKALTAQSEEEKVEVVSTETPEQVSG
jgi:hypothetical protein